MALSPDLDPTPPRRGRAALERALAEAADLLHAQPAPGSPEARRFDELIRQIEAYQPQPGEAGEPSPAALLERHLREAAQRRSAGLAEEPWSPMVGGDLRKAPARP